MAFLVVTIPLLGLWFICISIPTLPWILFKDQGYPEWWFPSVTHYDACLKIRSWAKF